MGVKNYWETNTAASKMERMLGQRSGDLMVERQCVWREERTVRETLPIEMPMLPLFYVLTLPYRVVCIDDEKLLNISSKSGGC